MAYVPEVGHFLHVENSALLGYCVACRGNFLPTIRDNLSVLFREVKTYRSKIQGANIFYP